MQTNPEFRKTILIGLGGAGQQIVLRTKRFFLDTYGVIPPSVKILCLDTDQARASIGSAGSEHIYEIEPSEFLHLTVDNPQDFIEHSSAKDWYIKPAPVAAIRRGAGAIRQNGRLGFFRHVNEVKHRIDKLLAQLNDVRLPQQMADAMQEAGATTGFALSYQAARNAEGASKKNEEFVLAKGDTEIYVCGSLAGGTGSGTFVDMGILLRRMAPRALIHGFFLLPWVYRGKSFAHRVRQNAYAALSEIDNLQSIMFGDDRFYRYSIGYADLEREPVGTAPYDLFHVIDGRNEYGENVDSVDGLCEIVSNAVFLSMGSMRVKVTSVVDNLLAHISVGDAKLWNGRYARYSSLSVSSIHYPAVELHRLVAATVARNLCRAALRELEQPEPSAAPSQPRQGGAQAGVRALIADLNLTREGVTSALCPHRGTIQFAAQPHEISDPDFPSALQGRLKAEKRALEQALDRSFQGQSQVFADETLKGLKDRLAEVAADGSMDRAARRDWISDLSAYVDGLRGDASEELVAATKHLADAEKRADDLLAVAEQSRYLPIIGGARKAAVQDWDGAVEQVLNGTRWVQNLKREKALYVLLSEQLSAGGAIDVPTTHELFDALNDAESRLQRMIALEEKNLDALRIRPNHVLLGQGRRVAWIAGGEAPDDSTGRPIPIDEIDCDYGAFREAAGIQTPDRYLDLYRKSPEALVDTFLGYCADRFESLRRTTVVEAMRTFAQHESDPLEYTRKQFDHLFRLASPLWSFETGRLGELQDLEVGRIVNIGLTDHQRELTELEGIAEDMRHAFHIGSDLAFSTTGDPQHIWMLSFAATIPAYLITGMDDARNVYENQISPSFHIDTEFEKELPDLMPEHEHAARALRILGMAIVGGIDVGPGAPDEEQIRAEIRKGIDVIHDEKRPKGHRFTFDDPIVRDLNFGAPITWGLFRDMYNAVQQNQDDLLTLIEKRLKQRIEELLALKPSRALMAEIAAATPGAHKTDVDGKAPDASSEDPRQLLKALIEHHICKLTVKLDSRDFSRLYSARLTYREIQELRYFLDNRHYAMGIDRYIQGTFVPRLNAH